MLHFDKRSILLCASAMLKTERARARESQPPSPLLLCSTTAVGLGFDGHLHTPPAPVVVTRETVGPTNAKRDLRTDTQRGISRVRRRMHACTQRGIGRVRRRMHACTQRGISRVRRRMHACTQRGISHVLGRECRGGVEIERSLGRAFPLFDGFDQILHKHNTPKKSTTLPTADVESFNYLLN